MVIKLTNQLTKPMTTIEIQIKEKNEILKGLEKTYETLLEFKKSKNSELVVLRNNKIVKIKPYSNHTVN